MNTPKRSDEHVDGHPDSSRLPEWRECYEAFGEHVFRLLHRMTGDFALAEDLTHDVFLRIHEARSQFGGAGTVAAWVFRIAGNIGRDELRRRAMRLARLTHFPADTEFASTGDLDLQLSLKSALDALGADQRAVVLLHDVDGYSHGEIARMLEIREGTSKARLSRARADLRVILGETANRALHPNVDPHLEGHRK